MTTIEKEQFIGFLLNKGLKLDTAKNYASALQVQTRCNHGTAKNWYKQYLRNAILQPIEDIQEDIQSEDNFVDFVENDHETIALDTIQKILLTSIVNHHKLILIKTIIDLPVK